MTLSLGQAPTRAELELFVKWAEELRNTLEDYFNKGQDGIRLKMTMKEPPKPRPGDIFYVGTVADGSTWDPDASGDGGYFGYHGGAWVKLG